MKRFISLSLAIIFALSLCFSTSATTTDSNTIVTDHYTIVFDEDSTLTQEEKVYLAEIRANYHHGYNDGASTYNVICNMFGHKTTTETIGVIEHCVSATQPRCLQTYEDLTVCSRCDYVQIDVLGSVYIYCCD